jgi:hypothetical protein
MILQRQPTQCINIRFLVVNILFTIYVNIRIQIKLFVLNLRNKFSCARDNLVPVTTACRVHRLRMEEWPPRAANILNK